ncbi:Allantoinase [termite gut metagenome]|uniref:Allantoinase n=1 Tax=termite gut metagenome TaxID=433724 RepID=A0A5J4Q135_9ZZZZ
MKRVFIKNALIINEGRSFQGSVVIEGEKIVEILEGKQEGGSACGVYEETIDAEGCLLLPGVIDCHVHFREPGWTYKADISSESKAAVAGGVTSVMDMPNTNPQTITVDALNKKFNEMGNKSLVNYSCYFGATNDNYTEFKYLDARRVCGVKVFMGSSTGNMLVDNIESLRHIFGATDILIAAHCENQTVIERNIEQYKAEVIHGDLPVAYHSRIRSTEACYRSSRLAVCLAGESGARLHLLHITTSKELELLNDSPLKHKRITAEACIPHHFFNSEYAFVHKFQHTNKRKLHHRHTRSGFQRTAFLFAKSVWSMVCCYHVNQAGINAGAQSSSVGTFLYGGVAFNLGTKS